jgi:chemotaxis protein methyltransferase CheR
MTDPECVAFLQWALPRLRFRWAGFRKVRRQVRKRIERRLQALGLPGPDAYRDYLESHPEEWPFLDSCCRITISRFYRDRSVFDYLGQVILPGLARAAIERGDRAVRCWSAGSASGEEPYTLAILAGRGPFAELPGVELCVLGTDADEHVVERARRGRYGASSLKDVPPDWLAGPLVQTGEEYEVREALRRQVEFRVQDVRCEMPEGPFDLVLCRNLAFTYFDEPLQREILRRIIERTRAAGVLVAGKQEPLPEPAAGLSPVGRNLGIYRVSRAARTTRGLDP